MDNNIFGSRRLSKIVAYDRPAWKLAQDLRSYQELGALEKAIQQATQQLAILNMSKRHSRKELIIDAICVNCNKRFTSMRGVSMHLKITATRHSVNFYGIYDKRTGLKEINRPELNFNLLEN
jgi:hypothetical protein